jgi:hypothetical protein
MKKFKTAIKRLEGQRNAQHLLQHAVSDEDILANRAHADQVCVRCTCHRSPRLLAGDGAGAPASSGVGCFVVVVVVIAIVVYLLMFERATGVRAHV